MNDDMTEQLIKAMEEKISRRPHIDTPFGAVFGARNHQEAQEMDEQFDLYNELLKQKERQEELKELYRVYYKMVEAWYRWLIADAHTSAINPRPKRTYTSGEPAWLKRFVLKQCGPSDPEECAITTFIGIWCPWENFGSSEIPLAKSVGWDQEIRSRHQRFSAMAGSKGGSLSAPP
jgi:hypothetical protein